MTQTVLRLPAVLNKTGLSRSAMYKLMANGNFPASIKLGARAVGWINYEVEDWLQNRISARNGESR